MQTYPAPSDSGFFKLSGSDSGSAHFPAFVPFSNSYEHLIGNGEFDNLMYSDNPSELLSDLDFGVMAPLPSTPVPSVVKTESRPMSAPLSAKSAGYHVGSNGAPVGFMPFGPSAQQHPPPSHSSSQHLPSLQPQSSRSALSSSGSSLSRPDSTVAPTSHPYPSALHSGSASHQQQPPPPSHHPTSPHREGLDALRDVRDGNFQRTVAVLLHKPRGMPLPPISVDSCGLSPGCLQSQRLQPIGVRAPCRHPDLGFPLERYVDIQILA
eukprot:TRINITY_DN2110_c0_g1_i4.p1 TRINITY_DN2110_c0_g1~~TRINITY_DN2110_c0_g1_i4.p1  ORF type:complete len:266 (-),score=23.28 TRINITY_DN2110_c0_g1_i4:92-889(-)